MKLRYYLRGLGIGIVVTALVMGMTSKAGRPLTDAEIRAKALTLGMVDSSSLKLADVGDSTGSQTPRPPEISKKPESSEAPGEATDPPASAAPEVSNLPAESTTPESTTPESTTPEPAETFSPSPVPVSTEDPVNEGETVTIVIVRGDSSYTVSRRLEEAGLIESARDFDAYLVDNGYSKTIRTGTYKIPVGASWEEIAKKIA